MKKYQPRFYSEEDNERFILSKETYEIDSFLIKELIYLAVWRFSNAGNYLSGSHLAHICEYSKPQASKKVKELEKQGWIRILENKVEQNHYSSIYCNQCGLYSALLQPHHKTQVRDGGSDNKENLILLCPLCHRKAHCYHFEYTDKFNDHFKDESWVDRVDLI